MLSWLTNAWRVPELRRRLLFTAMIIALYRLGSWVPAPGVDSEQIKNYFSTQGGTVLGPAQPLLGRRPLAVLALRARDHAVRHGVDHPPAPDRRHAVARAAPEGGRGRLREDQPVHALPHDRAGCVPVARLRVPLQAAERARGELRPRRDHRHHAHRRDGAPHVDGRADHEARSRQRHLDHHLRLDHRGRPDDASARGSTAARRRSCSSRSCSSRSPSRSSSSRRASARSRSSTPGVWSDAASRQEARRTCRCA